MRLCLRLLRSYLMMDHPLLLHWFTVNPSRRHPKLTGLPIGLSNRRMLNDPEAPEPNADMEKFEKYLRYFYKTVQKICSRNIIPLIKFRQAPPIYDGSPPLVDTVPDPRPNLIFANFKVNVCT